MNPEVGVRGGPVLSKGSVLAEGHVLGGENRQGLSHSYTKRKDWTHVCLSFSFRGTEITLPLIPLSFSASS